MQSITTIGLDLAKSIFQIHGIDGNGVIVERRTLRRSTMTPLPGRDGSLRERASLGARDCSSGA